MATLISTPQDLDDVRNDLAGTYKLANDIDMSDWGDFEPIGNIFTGNFDGDGYVISNLSVNKATAYSGLFARTGGASIRNLGLADVDIYSSANYVGGIAGYFSNSAIEQCYVTGSIEGNSHTGGITGMSTYRSTVENCYVIATLTGERHSGGLIGRINQSVVRRNYTVVDLVGGAIESNTDGRGSFYGSLGTSNTYAQNLLDGTIGSGNTGGSSIRSVSTTLMKRRSTYTGWNFDTIWQMDEGDYPTLQVFNSSNNIEIVNVTSHSNPIVSSISKAVKSNQNVPSYILPLVSESKRHVATLRIGNTYLSKLYSDVTQSHRSVRSSTAQVDTFIKPIHAMVQRKTKGTQSITSHINPLWSSTSILVPLNDEVVNAYLSWLENPSNVSYRENKTRLQVVENPSNVSYRENKTQLQTIENPTILEVVE